MISSKQLLFLKKWDSELDVLEGTIRSGKSYIGIRKFMLKVVDSVETRFIIAARDKQTAERNIIPLLEEQFGFRIDYRVIAKGGSQVKFLTPTGIKIIYVVGFEDKSRWKTILGSTLGGGFIDEANLSSMEFLREYFGRLATIKTPYTCFTLNPDDPNKEVYREFIDRCTSIIDIPSSIKEKQDKLESMDNWYYWHFDFRDNPLMDDEKIKKTQQLFLPGTIYYKTKILGLRARAENLIFGDIPKDIIVNEKWLENKKFKYYTAAIDTSYSEQTDDTNAFGFGGITTDGEYIKLDELVVNNKDVGKTLVVNNKTFTLPLSASDVCLVAYEFLEKNKDKYGFARNVIIDSKATVLEFDKYRRNKGWLYFPGNANKLKNKVKVIDRIALINSWIAQRKYFIMEHCKEHIKELEMYSYNDKGQPEDANNHTIDETCYEWIPYRDRIGG